MLSGCEALVPDVINVEGILNKTMKSLLELAIEDEACEEVEAQGYECNIPEQLKSIEFSWDHEKNEVTYSLDFCLKADCPVEE